jgi:hypothetical protein
MCSALDTLANGDNSWRLKQTSDRNAEYLGHAFEIVEARFNENTDENIQAYFQLPGSPRLPIDAAGTSILQASQILAYIALFKPQVL